jgi:broad specificity phosphatase PhoE
MNGTVYLVRHATPDWSRTDLRYDLPPGPPLTAVGEQEAAKLGEFLAAAGVNKIYVSPLERTIRTAWLATGTVAIPVFITQALAEWRRDESEAEVMARCRSFMDAALDESQSAGPIALITHGGPIRLLLQNLGLAQAEVDFYRRQFDRDNPLPPAGVWRLDRVAGVLSRPTLVFAPQEFKLFVPEVVYV